MDEMQVIMDRLKLDESVKCDRDLLSPLAKRRRRIVEIIEYLICAAFGVGMYILIGLALRWLGVA